METEIERRLQRSSKNQLVLLIQELTIQHPELSAEIGAVLDRIASTTEEEYNKHSNDADEQNEDEWDTSEELTTMDFVRTPEFPPLDLAAYRERFEGYLLRIK